MRYAATMSMKMMASQNGLLLPFAVYYAGKLGWHVLPDCARHQKRRAGQVGHRSDVRS